MGSVVELEVPVCEPVELDEPDESVELVELDELDEPVELDELVELVEPVEPDCGAVGAKASEIALLLRESQ